MTSQTLHSWHQISYIWHHFHSLGHHTTFCMTSSLLCLTSRPLYLCHHIHSVDDITPTVFQVYFCIADNICYNSSIFQVFQVYFCIADHICYNSRHHIHCIRHDSHCMTSQPLRSWQQSPYIWHHLQSSWYLVPCTCDITDTMFENTCQRYLTANTQG